MQELRSWVKERWLSCRISVITDDEKGLKLIKLAQANLAIIGAARSDMVPSQLCR